MQISSNGLITFKLPFTAAQNVNFTEEFSLFQDAIIAPLWTALTLRESARIYYRVSRSLSDLEAISSLIGNDTLGDNYYPTLAVIATWENIAYARDHLLKVNALLV